MSATPPSIDPIAIPAFAPPERPLEDDEVAEDAAADGWSWREASVTEGMVENADCVGALKSFEVTLKQGIWMTKSFASTNVYSSSAPALLGCSRR